MIGVLAATALSLSQPAAHADGLRTASASGTGTGFSAGETNAKDNARFALALQASRAGEMCTSVSATATHVYTAPDGSAYVFQGSATGYCAVTPPFTVHRAATARPPPTTPPSPTPSPISRPAPTSSPPATTAPTGWAAPNSSTPPPPATGSPTR